MTPTSRNMREPMGQVVSGERSGFPNGSRVSSGSGARVSIQRGGHLEFLVTHPTVDTIVMAGWETIDIG